MVTNRTTGLVAARVTRHSRDMAIEIEKAEVAIEKAAASAAQPAGEAQADAARRSKDVTAALRIARRALKKLRALVSRHSRDL